MKTIKIKFVDFWNEFDVNNNFILDILKSIYKIEICDKPDYIIYSVFGYQHLEYNCVRIFYTAENQVPDFNICDYAIGFNYLEFGDRYIRFPLYRFYYDAFDKAIIKHNINPEHVKSKNKFCNFIYSNNEADPIRDLFFKKLSEYKKVDSGGKHLNNLGYRVEDKYKFQSNYKFSIAFENTSSSGYTTEKIVEAFAAQTIPIYWGDPDITRDFNDKAFIWVKNKEIDRAIQKIIELDNNDELFLSMLAQPALINLEDSHIALIQFFKNIFEQDIEYAYRRTRVFHNKLYEERLRLMFRIHRFLTSFILSKKLKTYLRKILRKIGI